MSETSKRAKDLWLELHDKTQNAEAWEIIDRYLVGAVFDLEIRKRAIMLLPTGTEIQPPAPPVVAPPPLRLDHQEEDIFDFLAAMRYSARLDGSEGETNRRFQALQSFEEAELFIKMRRERLAERG